MDAADAWKDRPFGGPSPSAPRATRGSTRDRRSRGRLGPAGREPCRDRRPLEDRRQPGPRRPDDPGRARPRRRGDVRRADLGGHRGGDHQLADESFDRACAACSPSWPAPGPARASARPRPRSACSRSRRPCSTSSRRAATSTSYRFFAEFSRLVDDLGLFTFETYAAGPRAGDLRAGRRAARAVHAGGQAVGRHRVAAAGRHAGLGPHPGRDGEAAAGPGRHRLRARDHRHHRRRRRSTPRSPSTCSRPWWRPG